MFRPQQKSTSGVTAASAELPAVVAGEARDEGRHGLVGGLRLHLEVRGLRALALAASEHPRDPQTFYTHKQVTPASDY